jgi:hypothetical protein
VVFCLPAFLALGVFMAIALDDGSAWATEWLKSHRPQSPRLAAAPLVAVALLPLASFLVHHDEANQRDNTHDRARIVRGLDAAGHHALVLTDSYADAEYLWYYTVAEGLREERDLVVSPYVTPRDAVAYFARDSGTLAHNARFLAQPDGARIYTVSTRQAAAFARAGLVVVRVDHGIWEIRGPAELPRLVGGGRQVSREAT